MLNCFIILRTKRESKKLEKCIHTEEKWVIIRKKNNFYKLQILEYILNFDLRFTPLPFFCFLFFVFCFVVFVFVFVFFAFPSYHC